MKSPDNLVDYFQFKGGLNLVTPASSVPPGQLMTALNYEPDVNGGYRRFRGYERFDGHTRPSEAAYTAVACTLTATPVAGDTLHIGASSMRFLKIVDGGMLVFSLTGTIPSAMSIFNGVTNVGSTDVVPTMSYPVTARDEAQTLVDIAALLRADISAPPGAGPVRGVAMLKGVKYCWRDNVGLSQGIMYRATESGWEVVPLLEEVAFSNCASDIFDGDILSQASTTATVVRVVLTSGSFLSGTNTGYLILKNRSGGTVGTGAATVNGVALTITQAVAAQSFPPGGTYHFAKHNFFGGADTERLYGANGVGNAFEWCGECLVFLRTGRTDDRPSHVAAWLNYLWVGQGSSAQNSSVDTPYRWLASEGSIEFGMGADITGLSALPGQAIGVATTKSIKAIIGPEPTQWSVQAIAPESGALNGTFQMMSLAHAIDDSGLIAIVPSQASSAFEFNTVSRVVQPIIDDMRGTVVTACTMKQRNLYRVFCNDGRVLSMYADPKRIEFGMLSLPMVAHSVYCDYDTDGFERVFVGGADGMVYELDRPSTFDGEDLYAGCRLWYTNSRSPRVRKRYRKLVLEMYAELYTELMMQPDFQYGLADVVPSSELVETYGSGGLWEVDNWDTIFWDAPEISQPEMSLTGTAINIALTFYSSTKLDFGHVLQGAFLHYTPRRLQR
jgi:hypothetical protein